MPDRKQLFLDLARSAGFAAAGVAAAAPLDDYAFYDQWVAGGLAGPLGYLADHRAALRADPRLLLPSARTVLSLAMPYNTPGPERHAVSRYAWGAADYHDVLRAAMKRVLSGLQDALGPFEARLAVDTAPLLERSLARQAGLGWIGRNTLLINQKLGSWLFLGEILVSLEMELDTPPPDRCGSCRACIDACPTQALGPGPDGRYRLDARRCISTWTIEQRGAWAEDDRAASAHLIFGCDICQEVCPWNRRAPFTSEPAFQPVNPDPAPEELIRMTPSEFAARFRQTPIWRAKYAGLVRNALTAIGNAGRPVPGLETLAESDDEGVRVHARWAIQRVGARR